MYQRANMTLLKTNLITIIGPNYAVCALTEACGSCITVLLIFYLKFMMNNHGTVIITKW